MSWFSRVFKKAKKVTTSVFNKGKKAWNVAGQVGQYVHTHIMPKAKMALLMASEIPALAEFAVPTLAAVEEADVMLGTGLKLKKQIDDAFQKPKSQSVQTTPQNQAVFH